MATLLSVQSSARHDGSHSRQLSAELIARLATPGTDIVIERDLAEPIPQLDANWLAANWADADARTAEQATLLGLSDTLIAELEAADIVVIGVPIYNFSVPAALKAWVDQVARSGRTFRYTPDGPKGLLAGKKAYLVVASGGVPVDSAVDFATPYMRQVLRFIGITDVTTIAADGLVKATDDSLDRARRAIAATTHTAAA